MAALARRYRSQETLGLAFKEFSTALEQTNARLADPATATLNATLGAVFTLGLFESIVSTGQENISSWAAHTLELLHCYVYGDFKNSETSSVDVYISMLPTTSVLAALIALLKFLKILFNRRKTFMRHSIPPSNKNWGNPDRSSLPDRDQVLYFGISSSSPPILG